MNEKQLTEQDVRNAINAVIATERRMCSRYSELNPEKTERRKRDADMYILGAQMVLAEIQNRTGKS